MDLGGPLFGDAAGAPQAIGCLPLDGGPDRMTLWIAKDSRQAVKISAVMAQMGGAIMTAELASVELAN